MNCTRTKNRLASLLWAGGLLALILTSGCRTISVPADNQWRTIYAIQVPDREILLELTTVHPCGPSSACRGHEADAEPTEIRLVRLRPFQRFDQLPELNNPPPPGDGQGPLQVNDYGPQDMTLIGARRLVKVSTGSQLLVRTRSRCIGIRVRRLPQEQQNINP